MVVRIFPGISYSVGSVALVVLIITTIARHNQRWIDGSMPTTTIQIVYAFLVLYTHNLSRLQAVD